MKLRWVLALVGLATAVALSFLSLQPPAPLPASAPATEFSAERAIAQLAVIAARPHPTGTAAADEVRAFIAKQLEADGFTVDVQDATSVTDAYAKKWGGPIVAAHVHDLVARRRGSSGGPALMLMAHYDSRELAPGASDDGYGVATLLETARALAASPPLRHDIVLLVTEGEEQGLLGARAFFAESPVAKDVGLVLNFEARGDRGPVLMFQTSAHAAGLIDVLARAATHVGATSLSQEVYRRMPNDTDLTIALRAGYPAMNFANVDGFERYHRATDGVANASPATLQHHGSYALALARAFGDAEPMVPPSDGDEVYFDFGPAFVHYSGRAALPLAVATLLVLAGALVARVRRGSLVARAIPLGAAAALGAIVAAAGVAAAASWVATRSHGELAMPEMRDGVKRLYGVGFALLGAAVGWAVLAAAARRVRSRELAGGAMLVWAALAVAVAVLVPGASYVLVWPAAAAAIAALVPLAPEHPARIVADAAVAAVALMLLVPLARQLSVAFGPPIAPSIATTTAFAATAAVPLVDAVGHARRWIAPSALATAAVGCLAVACALPPFDSSSPRPDSLLYAVDADQSTASWLSVDTAPDAWTAKALAGAQRATVRDLFPRSTRDVLRAPAPLVEVGRPGVEVLSDARSGATRTLRLRVRPPAGAEALSLTIPPAAHVASATVQGQELPVDAHDGWLDLAFFGPPPDGIDLVLVAGASDAVPLRVVSQVRGLPPQLAAALGPRPDDRMPAVGWNALASSDMTLVGAGFRW